MRIRVQEVAWSLPDVIVATQEATDGVIGGLAARVQCQGLLEQGHGPAGMGITQFLGYAAQPGHHQVLIILVQQPGAASAFRVHQHRGRECRGVGLDSLIHRLPRDAEQAGAIGGRASKVKLQDSQGSSEDAGIWGLGQLATKPMALPGCQMKSAHALSSVKRSNCISKRRVRFILRTCLVDQQRWDSYSRKLPSGGFHPLRIVAAGSRHNEGCACAQSTSLRR